MIRGDATAETMADLRARLAAGASPSSLYILALAPARMRGASQVVRGPMEAADSLWRWCFWRADAPDPLGWPTRIRVCTRRTLPRWARRAVRRGEARDGVRVPGEVDG